MRRLYLSDRRAQRRGSSQQSRRPCSPRSCRGNEADVLQAPGEVAGYTERSPGDELFARQPCRASLVPLQPRDIAQSEELEACPEATANSPAENQALFKVRRRLVRIAAQESHLGQPRKRGTRPEVGAYAPRQCQAFFEVDRCLFQIAAHLRDVSEIAEKQTSNRLIRRLEQRQAFLDIDRRLLHVSLSARQVAELAKRQRRDPFWPLIGRQCQARLQGLARLFVLARPAPTPSSAFARAIGETAVVRPSVLERGSPAAGRETSRLSSQPRPSLR
jgi:hypothetical protein